METCAMGVACLKFGVECLLLFSADRLCRCGSRMLGILISAVISAAHTAACLITEAAFLSKPLWRLLVLAIVVLIAFGLNLSALYRSAVYILLNTAIGGLYVGYGQREQGILLIAAICICVVCVFAPSGVREQMQIPVELSYGEIKLRLKAMLDTGNTLCDPITGHPVLVIGADSAEKLTGLSPGQLRNPTQTLCEGQIPGLRLIPYKTIENAGGLLLALKLKNVRIGNWRGSSVVAFAPVVIGNGYDALTGGCL